MPRAAAPAVPIPARTAWAVPTGMTCSARAMRWKSTAFAAPMPIRVKPSVYFGSASQTTSNNPAAPGQAHPARAPCPAP